MKLVIALMLCICFSAYADDEDKYKPFETTASPVETGPVQIEKKVESRVLPALPQPPASFGRWDGSQITLMTLAYQIGTEIGAPQFAEVVQGILMQESHAGAGGREGGFHLSPQNRYYGVTQMKPVAVFDVLNSFPNLVGQYFSKPVELITWKEIRAKLLNDDEFAIRMAAHYYFKYASQQANLAGAVMAYNAGPGGVKKLKSPQLHPYFQGVKRYIQIAREFNKLLFIDPSKTLITLN